MNKICTSIEQSQKLIELGVDVNTADMYWWHSGKRYYIESMDDDDFNEAEGHIRAWSLAALLAVIPYNVTFNKAVYRFKLVKFSDHWECYHENFGTVSTEIFKADSPVDACYKMILKLNELNLL